MAETGKPVKEIIVIPEREPVPDRVELPVPQEAPELEPEEVESGRCPRY